MKSVLSCRSLVQRCVLLALIAACSPSAVRAQDLVPGAYTPAPVGFNIVTLLANLSDGDLTFDPSLPVEDGHATIGVTAVGFSRTLNIAGRYASVGLIAPYMVGSLEGRLIGQFQQISRSGTSDLSARVVVNVYGAPAMKLQQFAAHRPKTIVGVSVTVGVPSGQYDPAKLINIGTNRWSMRPEVGISRKRGRWTLEGVFGLSLFTDNTNFSNGGTRAQAPIASVQGHLIYAWRPGLWLAGDGNFWKGGRLTINGAPNIEDQRNSRLGMTLAVPIKRQQVRIAYSFGAYTTIGGDFQSLGVSYSYIWANRP